MKEMLDSQERTDEAGVLMRSACMCEREREKHLVHSYNGQSVRLSAERMILAKGNANFFSV